MGQALHPVGLVLLQVFLKIVERHLPSKIFPSKISMYIVEVVEGLLGFHIDGMRKLNIAFPYYFLK